MYDSRALIRTLSLEFKFAIQLEEGACENFELVLLLILHSHCPLLPVKLGIYIQATMDTLFDP